MNKADVFIPGYPICRDIVTKRNDTFIWEVTGFNKDGTPFDFTNKEFLLQVKDNSELEETLINMPDSSFSVDQDSRGVDAGVFNILVVIHPKEEMDLAIDSKPYDLQMTDDQDQTFTFYEGVFTVTRDVSRLQEDNG